MSLTMGAAAQRFGRIAAVSCLAFVAGSAPPANHAVAADSTAPIVVRGRPFASPPTLHAASGSQGAAGDTSSKPLEDTYWRAIELAGKVLPRQNANREAHLIFQTGGRVSGSDGCNRFTGTYQRTGDALTFGQLAGTQMACGDTGEIERAFHEAVKNTARLTVAGDRLRLLDSAGMQVALFAAGRQTAASTPPSLAGTSWQLVRFEDGSGKALTPDDRAKYTIDFAADGQLSTRVDCNRGRGTWAATDQAQLQLGPLALTRAQCPPGSLHDQVVGQWSFVRSYVIRDGHLFLSLMADGGAFEFEPVRKA
jgi:heat shock protein HslJ